MGVTSDQYINEEDQEQKRKRQIIDDFFNKKSERSEDEEEEKYEDLPFGCPGKHELKQFITEDDKYYCDVCS